MWSLVGALVPYAIDIIVKYVESSDSSKDDKVLDVVKIGAEYLARKSNNNLSFEDCEKIKSVKMKG